MYIVYTPGTQMTLVLLEKGLVLEGSNPKIEDKQVPGIYIYIYTRFFRIYAAASPTPPPLLPLWMGHGPPPPLWLWGCGDVGM